MEIIRAKDRFYVGDSEQSNVARIVWDYQDEHTIRVISTYVDPMLRGQNIAGRLLDEVINMARTEGLKIIPVCSYVVKKMTRNDEYKDILY